MNESKLNELFPVMYVLHDCKGTFWGVYPTLEAAKDVAKLHTDSDVTETVIKKTWSGTPFTDEIGTYICDPQTGDRMWAELEVLEDA